MTKQENNNNNSVNRDEIKKFSDLSDQWWDESGSFKTLHQINYLRVKYIAEILEASYENITDKSLLDVGCGGGLLCEPLARIGLSVKGVDASEENILIAKEHAKKSNLKINYENILVESIKEKFDIVTCLEVLEHVDNLEAFVENCCSIVKKNGFIFFSTINRNIKSYLQTILGAEYLLRWVPAGTHDWNKYIKPSELYNIIEKAGLEVGGIKGFKYNPLRGSVWSLSDNIDVNYILYAKKL